MNEPTSDRRAERRHNGLANEQLRGADPSTPRTLDDEQATRGSEPSHQPVPEPKEYEGSVSLRGEGRKQSSQERHCSTETTSSSRPISDEGACALQSPDSDLRTRLPSENLFTLGELLLAVVTTIATFLALRWILNVFAGGATLHQTIVTYQPLFSLTVGLGVGMYLLIARRTKRLNRAKHLRGELPT